MENCKKGYKEIDGNCVKESELKKYLNNAQQASGVKLNLNVGISFLSFLTLIFITLKLVNVINWSWIWILSPLWIPITLSVIVFIFSVFIIRKKR